LYLSCSSGVEISNVRQYGESNLAVSLGGVVDRSLNWSCRNLSEVSSCMVPKLRLDALNSQCAQRSAIQLGVINVVLRSNDRCKIKILSFVPGTM
jgi:hypothetical protein